MQLEQGEFGFLAGVFGVLLCGFELVVGAVQLLLFGLICKKDLLLRLLRLMQL